MWWLLSKTEVGLFSFARWGRDCEILVEFAHVLYLPNGFPLPPKVFRHSWEIQITERKRASDATGPCSHHEAFFLSTFSIPIDRSALTSNPDFRHSTKYPLQTDKQTVFLRSDQAVLLYIHRTAARRSCIHTIPPSPSRKFLCTSS